MGQRQIDEALVASIDQVRTLLEAQSLYVRNLPVGELPDHERRMIADLRHRVLAARDQAGGLIARLMRRLDPYEDAYAFQPAEPVELTPLGVIPKTSGFCNYQDAVTVQNVAADAFTVLLNNRISVMETQKPVDVDTFFRDQRIRVQEGDAVAIRVQAMLTPVDPGDIASFGQIGLQITPGTVIFPQTFVFNGYGEAISVSYSTTAYAGRNWAENGAAIVVEADGPFRVTSRTLLVTRLHKGR